MSDFFYKVTSFPPFTNCALCKEATLCSPYPKNRSYAEYLHKIFWILLHQRFLPYLFSHLFIIIIIIFINMDLMQYCFILVLIILAVATGKQITTTNWFFTNSSLLSGTTTGSRFIFCISCPTPRISHISKEPYFILLDNVLQTMIWVLGMCTATGCCPVSWQSRKIYMHT